MEEIPEIYIETYFSDLGESAIGQIVAVRTKKLNGEKLEEYEEKIYKQTKLKLSKEEQEEEDEVKKLNEEETRIVKEKFLKLHKLGGVNNE